ncbi:glutamate--tRNA ligase [Mesonia sp.]|uniref:glutamate--tRNA ligase n=1 Tax=Mesonia sp. TaxID=1960830 RepID=UPI001773E7AF|nr:glutamate--tRNA ligase [Mesonia sp.]HIB36761.1 glutamate--tRNA ligase [Mesonia sp.]HIO27592.1 glutamate--tRNA ligase [Flavobacteriaceae bacterium]
MSQRVRVRFAPSPTGPLHIGGVRTALFNYLFAKKHEGDFVLRIEDTDQTRYVEGAEDYIVEALNWLNIPYDEGPGKEGDAGPYRQSERKGLYREYADKLLASGNAYYAFDTAEELAEKRAEHEAQKETFIYNWHNREELNNSLALSEEETKQKIESGEPYVIRFKAPENEELDLQDEIRGDIQVNTKVLDDKVLFKSDGMPTYHLANIVDDHLMKITHVIRGEEWLPSLALHVLLYRAFGWEAPKFAHLPLILKPTGKGKLSKRDGDKMGFPVFPLEWKDPKTGDIASGYREDGYLPQTVLNMLVFLGWNEGEGSEKEIYTLEELTQAFSLAHVSKGGSKFDPEKTKWFQHHYLQEQDNVVLAEQFLPILKEKNIDPALTYVEEIVKTIKERATFVSDFWELSSFYFEAPTDFDAKASKKAWKKGTAEIMQNVKNVIDEVEDFNQENLQEKVKGWITNEGIGFGKVMQPLRLSLVGEMKGPDLFHIMTSVGKEETLKRIDFAIEKLG